MLSPADRTTLESTLKGILLSSMPVMAHSADGVADSSVLAGLHDEILEIVGVQFALQARERNTNLSISRLPTDVLRYLATFLPYRDRVFFATICHAWREAIQLDERVWKHPLLYWTFYHRTQMATSLLERAAFKPLTLGIQSDSPGGDGSRVASMLSTCLTNLTSLTILLKHDTDEGPWHQILTRPAPQLEILRVSKTSEGVYELPENLFNGECPHFRTAYLHGVLTPTTTCRAFDQVTTLGYYAFSTLASDSISVRLGVTPNLETLVISSSRYLLPSATASWTIPPKLKSLSIRRNITDGIFSALASAVLARGGHLMCYEPIAMYSDAVLFRINRPVEIRVRWIGASDDLCFVAFNDTGASNGVVRVREPDILRHFEFSLSRLIHITRLTLPDTLWQRVTELSAHTSWDCLVFLEVHLTNVGPYDAPYTYLFLLQDPPLSSLCPMLREVELVHDAMRGTAYGAYLPVIAADLSGWLPATTSVFQGHGLVIRDPGLVELYARPVEIVLKPFKLDDLTLPVDDAEWDYVFPYGDSWRL